MKVTIKAWDSFKREFKRLGKRYASLADDYERLLDELTANPCQGADLGGGVRKIRMRIAAKGKGKSGGARVITLNVIVSTSETTINLLYVYDKADIDSISKEKINQLLRQNGFV